MVQHSCHACGHSRMAVFLEIEDVCVFCNVLWNSRSEAIAAPRARIRLARCNRCGLIYNISFTPELTEYSPAYENSLHCSGQFQQWAEDAADRLIRRYQLHNKDIIEIGCGRGEFLSILQRLGDNRVVGFDPSYGPTEAPGESDEPAIAILPEPYSEIHADYPADFICCRHVLEHIDRPLDFLKQLRKTIGPRETCVVYFEVPNGLHCFERGGLWDIIYEHCSYFTAESLAGLFRRAGFEPIELTEPYDGQFLTIEARPAGADASGPSGCKPAVSDVRGLVDNFQNIYLREVRLWRDILSGLAEKQSRTVVWGAGSKGVTFLNTLGISDQQIEYIVDVNPRKQGRFIAGTGQKVVSPDFLREYHPRTIIIMNSVYRKETQDTAQQLGLDTEFLVA